MANVLDKPRFWKKKAVLFKAETEYGKDAIPTGAANWVEARNVSFTPVDAETVERNIEMPYMGSAGKLTVGKWAKLSFDVALVGSGTKGLAPKLGVLLLACAFAETVVATTSVAYNLVSELIGSGTLYINIDGTLHKLLGARGSMKVTANAKAAPTVTLSYDAIFVAPVEGPIPTVVRTGWQIEEGINSENTAPCTINGVDLAWSALSFDQANKIARYNLPGPQREVAITDRAPVGEITVLAPALSVFDPFALQGTGVTYPISILHGSVDGKKVKIDLKATIENVAYDNVDGVAAYKLSLGLPPSVGNDEIALTFL